MKDQVSVYIDELASEVTLISKVELERLMRLDENRKKKIAQFKECIGGKLGHYYLVNIELLESLDK